MTFNLLKEGSSSLSRHKCYFQKPMLLLLIHIQYWHSKFSGHIFRKHGKTSLHRGNMFQSRGPKQEPRGHPFPKLCHTLVEVKS